MTTLSFAGVCMLILLSLLFSLTSLLLVGWVLVKLPEDYFVHHKEHHWIDPVRYPNLYKVLRMVKNLIGIVLIVVGIILIFMPGQGVLTIVIGLILTDFPAKKRWLEKLLRSKGVRKSLDMLRRKAGKRPFLYP
jgi:archaellum biogenesis protein FlaJ (TadC family)